MVCALLSAIGADVRLDFNWNGPIRFPSGNGAATMQDMQVQLEKLRADAAECALIRDLATDPKKRDLFTRLADHLMVLASEVERAIADSVKRTG